MHKKSNKLLLLDNSYRADVQDIWKVAINNNWSTCRTNIRTVEEDIGGFDLVRYYGNSLHANEIKDKIPNKFIDIDPNILPHLGEFTGRKIKLMKYGDLKQPIEKDCFIKPVFEKFFEAKIYKKGDKIEGAPLENDLIYVQDIMYFFSEIRCFVLGGKILTSSFYRIYGNPYHIPAYEGINFNHDKEINSTSIPRMVKDICDLYPELNFGIVMDFGFGEEGDFKLVEFNEAYCSGLYHCDPEKAFKCIIKSQYDK